MIEEQNQKFNVNKIYQFLSEDKCHHTKSIKWFEEISSTNDYLLSMTHVEGKICLAEKQVSGRGRRGKFWLSGFSDSVLMSIGYRIPEGGDGLVLVSGLAVATCLINFGVKKLGLKWPNDVVVNHKKLCGILIETRGMNYVIGIGLNISISSDISKNLDQNWVDLSMLNIVIDRNQLVASLISYHDRFIQDFKKNGITHFLDRWNKLHVNHKRWVEVSLSRQTFIGVVNGVNDDGSLSLIYQGRVRNISSVTASIRPHQKREHNAIIY